MYGLGSAGATGWGSEHRRLAEEERETIRDDVQQHATSEMIV